MADSSDDGKEGRKPFRPQSYTLAARKPPPASFQVNMNVGGDLGRRMVKAQRAAGMTARAFVTACVIYALDHMEEDS